MKCAGHVKTKISEETQPQIKWDHLFLLKLLYSTIEA